MARQDDKSITTISLPPYLRRAVLFDKLISCAVVVITVIIGAFLLVAAANPISLFFGVGLVLFVIGIWLNI